ncbi:MAG: hypothetical protein ACKPKO_58355, partial [Candidatus Fonsibacter sp.]
GPSGGDDDEGNIFDGWPVRRSGQISCSDLPSSYGRSPPPEVEYIEDSTSDYRSVNSGMIGGPIGVSPTQSRRWGNSGRRRRRGTQPPEVPTTLASAPPPSPPSAGAERVGRWRRTEPVAHPNDDYIPPSPREPQLQPISVQGPPLPPPSSRTAPPSPPPPPPVATVPGSLPAGARVPKMGERADIQAMSSSSKASSPATTSGVIDTLQNMWHNQPSFSKHTQRPSRQGNQVFPRPLPPPPPT